MNKQNSHDHPNNSEDVDEVPSLVKRDITEPNEGSDPTNGQNRDITVRVKTMDENERTIGVSLDDKVIDLKNKILDELEVPLERQRLIYLGKQLKDDQTIEESRLKNDVCILLVANRVQNQSDNQRQAEARPNNEGPTNDVDLPTFIFNALNESAQMRRNRRLLFQQNARSFLRNLRLNVGQSRETIVQNLATTEQLIASCTNVENSKINDNDSDNSLDCFDFEKRELKVGQWVDVKDTINQWLEAQVVEVGDGKAFIHYNGWGTRWDEWVEMSSQRIAVFRTHTIQAATSSYLSPFPNTPTDTEDNIMLSTPSASSNQNLDKICDLSGTAIQMMSKLKNMRDKYDRRLNIQREMVEEEYKRRTMKKKLEETKTKYFDQGANNCKISEEDDEEDHTGFKKSKTTHEETKREVSELEDEVSKSDLQKIINDNAQLQQQIILLSGQLAPIMDRVGRVFTDFSPHLVYDVNGFNNDLRPPRANRNEERKRNRRRHSERQRNRSQENSRGSDLDEEFDDQLSNSTNSLSRNSDRSNEREGRRANGESTNIRTRLRSLSNTISQIRSSISSMRNLIFNNLGGGENGENVEEELQIDQRGQNLSTVNVQVPIISSPGDIASVHNIFDRFVDRQMVNIMSGENEPNAQTPQADPASNTPNPNPAAATTSNRQNRQATRANGPQIDLTGGAGNLGMLSQALGGTGAFGAGSDTIELHIHAFMPSNRDVANPNNQNTATSPELPSELQSILNQAASQAPAPQAQPTPPPAQPTLPPVQQTQPRPSLSNTSPLARTLTSNSNIQVTATNVQTEINGIQISRGNTMHEITTPISMNNDVHNFQNSFGDTQNLITMGINSAGDMQHNVNRQSPSRENRFAEVGVQANIKRSRRGRQDRNRQHEDSDASSMSMDSNNHESRRHQERGLVKKEIKVQTMDMG
jgi:hypothetical protein